MNRFSVHFIPPYAPLTQNHSIGLLLLSAKIGLIFGLTVACESSRDDDSTFTNTTPTEGNASSQGTENTGDVNETGESTTSESGDSGTASSDTGIPTANPCLPSPYFLCNMPYDCVSGPNLWVCGALNSPLDEQGCLRSRCLGHQDCVMGEKCFSDYRCNEGGCTASNMICRSHSQGPCECSGADDCSGEHGWCVPEAIYECPLEETTETSTTSDATGSSSSGGTEAGTSSESTN